MRFLPHYTIIRAVLDSGELGTVRVSCAEFSRLGADAALIGWKPRVGRRAALDLGYIRRRSSTGCWAARSRNHRTREPHRRGVDAQAVAILDYPEAYAVYESSIRIWPPRTRRSSCEEVLN